MAFSGKLWPCVLFLPLLTSSLGGSLPAIQSSMNYPLGTGGGKIYRFDPNTGERTLIVENTSNIASLVFGQGDFDQNSLYGTATRGPGGGRVWVIPPDATAGHINR